jgi:RNA polymerase sigma-70 factor (ECF subfamily)
MIIFISYTLHFPKKCNKIALIIVFYYRKENMEQEKLSQIVAQARKGSEQAYRELVEAFGTALLGYFYRNTGSRSEADDLVQDTFLRLVRGLKNYRENERFEVWLYRLARNLLVDYWRKRKMINAGDVCHDENEEWIFDSPANRDIREPADQLAEKEIGDELQKMLMKLSVDQRETILMRYFSELSFEEIAAASGVPLGTALARVHRGLKLLKQLMGNEVEGNIGSDGRGAYLK